MQAGSSSHFSLKRGGVGRARKHAAYVIGAEKYASREDVLHVASGNMPSWAAEPLHFWEAADQYERANGRAYLEEEFAIPRELSHEQAKKLVDSWAAKEFGDRHAWMYGIHSKPAEDGRPNIHCHLMFSDRIFDGIERPPEMFFRRPASRYRDPRTGKLRQPDPAKGGAGKDRQWNDRQIVKELRGRWEGYANEFLVEHGHRPRLDLRSNAERSLDQPEPKIGPVKRRADRWRDDRREDVLIIRQRRRRIHEDIRNIKSELREARRERARRDVRACQDETHQVQRPYSRSPLAAMHAEQRAGRTLFRWADGAAKGRAAIIDRGGQLSLCGKTSIPKVSAMIQLAKTKGWQKLRLSGPDEFKHLAIREALRAGVQITNPELADLVARIQMEDAMQNSISDARLAMAKEWLAVTAPVDALQAAVLRKDVTRLMQLFDQSPNARRWEFIQRQRAEGVPEALLGYQIDQQRVTTSTEGIVRHVGSRAWIEPADRPGVVISIRNAPHLRPGQRVKAMEDGSIQLLQSEMSLQPPR